MIIDMLDGESDNKRVREFLDGLEALCILHDIQLTTSGYDGLQLWDREGEDAVYCAGIEDRTKGNG